MSGLFRPTAAGRMSCREETSTRFKPVGNVRISIGISVRECSALSTANLGNCPGVGKTFA